MGGRRASGWWRDLVRVRGGGGGVGGEWFSDVLPKCWGMGETLIFELICG